jgi:hypothetical protein
MTTTANNIKTKMSRPLKGSLGKKNTKILKLSHVMKITL